MQSDKNRKLIVHLNNYDKPFRGFSDFVAENTKDEIERNLNIELPDDFDSLSAEEKIEWFEDNEYDIVEDFNTSSRDEAIEAIMENIEN